MTGCQLLIEIVTLSCTMALKALVASNIVPLPAANKLWL